MKAHDLLAPTSLEAWFDIAICNALYFLEDPRDYLIALSLGGPSGAAYVWVVEHMFPEVDG